MSSHKVHNPSREASGSGAPVTTGRALGRYSGSPSPLHSKSQEPGPEFNMWVNQMESLEAAGCSLVPLLSLTSDEQLNLFLHLKTRSNNSSTCSEKSNHQSTQQMSAFLFPNHEWSCALDSGQKTLKETLWTLSLWSKTRPWNVNTYTRRSLSPKGFIFTFWHVLAQHSYLSFLTNTFSNLVLKQIFFSLIHNFLPIIPKRGY